ncbi:peptide MFS transporter [Staphylococcus devriesei]|uniref:Peptide MFS transporter n=1 Tax=Staphylococcus devriesei TaxID=586733 RepID=A0A2K4DV11_9STAP|nr:peptide MFS transporter [Staphylococcus devriesei]MCE5090552.1 peptide MFS transporter [Staphylococcus devriesei]MCE5096680.1 peptide MFS transporter [Staphylococcus devriesei]PNZ90622.1 MFS transporter [Staphylococcus devriesei]PTE73502.1 peptide MFS transporter [Staphylococcus devriesei]PTF02645.1 peptide MFS transporter [Staphylococcus devriesei]
MNTKNYSRQEIVKSVPQKGFFGHPRGLSTLFFTEFWERFSYYGMKAILAFYLYYSVSKGGFGLPQATALQIVSLYGALIYMSGTIGGWIADRIIGTRHALFYGGILIMFGHIMLTIPGNLTVVMIALLLLIAGTGLLKPNISTTVGELYDHNDRRLDAAFTIFYMGINLGSFLSPFITGYLQTRLGFHFGFAIAAIGMFIGLVTYLITNKKSLGLAGLSVPNPLRKDEIKSLSMITGIVIAVFIIVLVVLHLFGNLNLGSFSVIITFVGIVLPIGIFIYMLSSQKTRKEERSRIYSYIPLFITSVAFWMIQEQGSTILANFADQKTQLSLGKLTHGLINFHIPAAWFQSINPVFIILLAPLFANLWTKLGKHNPSTVYKFALGAIFAGFSYLVMIIPLSGNTHLIHPLWLIVSFLLITIGELCISPVGLSVTSKLAPAKFSAQMMALWMLSNATAQSLNSQIVVLFKMISEKQFFLYSGLFTLVIGILLVAISPMVKKAMNGVH